MLKATPAGTGFNKDNPEDYYSDWFAWENTLFGELILKIYNENSGMLALRYQTQTLYKVYFKYFLKLKLIITYCSL